MKFSRPWASQIFNTAKAKACLDTKMINMIPKEEYALRRHRLMKSVPDGSIMIFPGSTLSYKSEHIFYPFRQASDFYYLTGLNEKDCALMLEKCPPADSDGKGYKMSLFLRPADSFTMKWEGQMCGFDNARELYAADNVYPISNINDIVRQKVGSYDHIYLDDASVDGNVKINSASSVLSKLRLVKSESELQLLRKAGEITSLAFIETMKYAKPGMIENMVEAKLDFEMKIRGSDGLAYVPVCASGANANVIHYTTNKMPINDGDMILVDAGCDYNHYVSDFTRTWPVGNKFTPIQRNLYNIVQNTLTKLIPKCTEGNNLTLDQLHVQAEEELYDGILKLGIKMPYRHMQKVFPHHIGHYVGLDVHDVDHESKTQHLKAGCVIAVEPGLYIDYDDPYFPSQYHGIGIRLEDNVVVGLNYSESLSKGIPLLASEVETIIN